MAKFYDREAHQTGDTLYFFVSGKNEALLCEEYREELQNRLGVTIFGAIGTFRDMFGYVMDLSYAIIAEVKRQAENIDMGLLRKKAENIVNQLPGYRIEFRGYSLVDM